MAGLVSAITAIASRLKAKDRAIPNRFASLCIFLPLNVYGRIVTHRAKSRRAYPEITAPSGGACSHPRAIIACDCRAVLTSILIVRDLRRLFVLAVIAAAAALVFIVGLLLVGVKPRLVFSPGFALRSSLDAIGIDAHNRVGVMATAVFW
jgi:hypothetical protein